MQDSVLLVQWFQLTGTEVPIYWCNGSDSLVRGFQFTGTGDQKIRIRLTDANAAEKEN